MKSILRKAGLATMAAGAILSTAMVPNMAHAGTGGTTNNGIAYGQDALYCDGSLNGINKTDASSGQALNGATFNVTVPGNNANVALKAYTQAQVDAGLPAQDKANWILAFNKSIDNSWTGSAYGATYKAASIQLSGGNQTGVADGQGTQYTTSETITYPADIRNLTDANAQSAAMTNWPNMAAGTGTVSVSSFFTTLKTRLDAEGAALYTNYSADAPTDPATAPDTAIAGTNAAGPAQAEYQKAYTEFQTLLNTIRDAGYTGVSYTGTTVTFGAVNTGAQNFTQFTTDYTNLVAQANYPFGFQPATYDLVAKVVGNAPVAAANAAADTSVGAADPGSAITVTSDNGGKAYYESFGRDNTGTATTAPATTCDHLAAGVQETAAPAGYNIDNTAVVTSTPTNLDPYATGASAVSNTITFTDTLTTVAVNPNGSPVNPRFDSGK